MCEHSAKSWRPLHAHTHTYIYSYTLFTLYLSTLWHSLQACCSRKLGISLFTAPWNELWVKLLLKPHWFSAVQLTLARALRAQMAFVCSSCTLHFTQECAGHSEANFYSLHTNVRTQVAFQPAYQLEQKIQHLCVTFPQDEDVKSLHTLHLSQGDEDTVTTYKP